MDGAPGPLRLVTTAVESAVLAAGRVDAAEDPRAYLGALIDVVVDELVPVLTAAEATVSPLLEAAERKALCAEGRRLRELAEGLMAIAEVVGRSRRPAREARAVTVALERLECRLRSLHAAYDVANDALLRRLGDSVCARLAGRLATTAAEARAQTVLIDRPVIPETVAVVLRSNPELRTAYRVTLADLDRRRLDRQRDGGGGG